MGQRVVDADTNVVDHEGHVPSNNVRDLGVEAPGGPGEVVRYESTARAREFTLQVGRQRFELRLVATHQHDGHAALDEASRKGAAEPLRAAGHEGSASYASSLSFEPRGARPSQETRRPAPQGDSHARAAVQKCEQADAAQRRAGIHRSAARIIVTRSGRATKILSRFRSRVVCVLRLGIVSSGGELVCRLYAAQRSSFPPLQRSTRWSITARDAESIS